MKLKRLLLVSSLLVIMLLSITAISAQDNQTDYAISKAKENSFEDIQHQIDTAEENSTVTLKGEYKDSGNIHIDKAMTIAGENAVIVQNDDEKTIEITSDNVIIKDITFKKACHIKLNRTTTFISCIFRGNDLTKGSVIDAELTNGACLNIINCTFIQNKGYGMVENAYGGAINVVSKDTTNTSKLNIINTRLVQNTAYNGGAISIITNRSFIEANVISSSFEKNTVLRGALYFENNYFKNRIIIRNSNFTDNSILDYGLAIWEGYLDEEIMIFPEDQSADIALKGNREIFDKKMGNVEVYISDLEAVIENCNIKRANPLSGWEYSCNFANNNVRLIDSNFINSNILFSDYQLTLAIDKCNFKSTDLMHIPFNISNYDSPFDSDSWMRNPGEEIYDISLKNSNLEKSTVLLEDAHIDGCNFADADISADSVNNCSFTGKSVISSISDINITNCEFDNNINLNGIIKTGSSRQDYENLINPQPWDSGIPAYTIFVENCSFTNNYARYEGGVIYCNNENVTLIVENCIFQNNTARNGGAIYAFGSSKSRISNCIFENCHAENTDKTVKYPNDYDRGDNIISERLQYIDNPQFYFENLYDANSDKIGGLYYGNVIFGNVSVENNFWGSNINSPDEFAYDNIIKGDSPKSWVNLKIENNTLKFVLNDGSEIKNIPKYQIKANGNTIQMENGTAALPTNNLTLKDIRTSADKPVIKEKAHIEFEKKGNYTNEMTITATLLDSNNKTLAGETLYLKIGNKNILLKTDNEGKATYQVIADIGTYNVTAKVKSDSYKNANDTLENVEINPLAVKMTVKTFKTTFDSNKAMSIKVTYKNAGVKGVRLAVKVFTNKKSKTYYVTSNAKGIASFIPSANVNVGSHKIEITSASKNYKLSKATTTLKISKAKTIIKADKVTSKYKKSKYFKVTVKNKETKKAIKNLKIKVKVGKKAYTIKTNYKGIAQFNTKILKVGKYAVQISSGNSNYEISKKSTIIIKR